MTAEEADEAIEQAADAEALRIERRPSHNGHEPAGHAVERLERQRALTFRGDASFMRVISRQRFR